MELEEERWFQEEFPSLVKFVHHGVLKHDDGSGETLDDFFDAHIVIRRCLDKQRVKKVQSINGKSM